MNERQVLILKKTDAALDRRAGHSSLHIIVDVNISCVQVDERSDCNIDVDDEVSLMKRTIIEIVENRTSTRDACWSGRRHQ